MNQLSLEIKKWRATYDDNKGDTRTWYLTEQQRHDLQSEMDSCKGGIIFIENENFEKRLIKIRRLEEINTDYANATYCAHFFAGMVKDREGREFMVFKIIKKNAITQTDIKSWFAVNDHKSPYVSLWTPLGDFMRDNGIEGWEKLWDV